jgi:hypothetical protein
VCACVCACVRACVRVYVLREPCKTFPSLNPEQICSRSSCTCQHLLSTLAVPPVGMGIAIGRCAYQFLHDLLDNKPKPSQHHRKRVDVLLDVRCILSTIPPPQQHQRVGVAAKLPEPTTHARRTRVNAHNKHVRMRAGLCGGQRAVSDGTCAPRPAWHGASPMDLTDVVGTGMSAQERRGAREIALTGRFRHLRDRSQDRLTIERAGVHGKL